MSRGFWMAIALITTAFSLYEIGINFYLRRLHTTAVQACVRVESVAPYTQARAE